MEDTKVLKGIKAHICPRPHNRGPTDKWSQAAEQGSKAAAIDQHNFSRTQLGVHSAGGPLDAGFFQCNPFRQMSRLRGPLGPAEAALCRDSEGGLETGGQECLGALDQATVP